MELDAAAMAGIEVEVVPGISSALAGPALAGIAVTERSVSAHVTVLSGHRLAGDNDRWRSRPDRACASTPGGDGVWGRSPHDDWSALARGGGTLVVLMAASTGPAVAAALVGAGMDGATPVAVVVEVARADQHVIAGTLERLAARENPLPGPCVVVIGEVARRASAVAATFDDLVALGRR